MVDPSQSTASPGKTLKQARERLGLSVLNVARDLHLSKSQIDALEADDYQHFHGETYVRGYLRSYARLVGVDPDQVLPRSKPTVEKPTDVPESAAQSADPGGRRLPWLGVGLFVIIGGLGYLVYTSNSNPGSEPARAPVPPAVPISQTDRSDSAKLLFAATAPSWVEVRDARGHRLVYETIIPDRAVAIEGQPPFHVYVGNAQAVEVQYNGLSYDLTSHIQGLHARFVVK
ncbi:MAG: DUF4115 domain-containing protein [Gammaproteobacteria bacterium]|nr:DUF4115 domain-containing protein [Gammaproteobacteria bacterium]